MQANTTGLRVGSLGEAHLNGGGRLALLAFLRSVFGHQKHAAAEGHNEGAGGGFQTVERIPVVHILQFEVHGAAGLQVVVEGTTPGAKRRQAAAEVHKWSQSGATWWLEALWSAFGKEDGPASVHKRITQGPPR